ncbi:MAG TPA: AMP-binding protein [Solirubrobacteraceae bacterium]|jgi:O-succinylbenzoic acid--CoA ligase|nr:AMP-binding protein [Solirubrobacteraceae bacterium]
MLLDAWLERAASHAPRTAAIETPQGGRSYAQLLQDARLGAAELAARGAAPGERVAIELPPGLPFAQALHACLLLGAVAVPIDLRLSEREREPLCAGAAVRVTEPLALDPRRGGKRGGIMRGGMLPEGARHDTEAPAVVIHTSGTTSAPRPVELTYGNLLWSALGSGVALGVDPGERWLCALPLSHVGGLSILIRSAIYGTTAVVHERFETDRALAALHEEGVTVVSVVANTLARLLDAGLENPPTLRCALTGGGPVPVALRERAHAAGVPVSLTYGLTEASSQVTTTPLAELERPGPGGGDRPATAGPPLFCTRLRIERPDARRNGAGELSGEILLAGPTIAPGSVGEDGWLRTGDEGRVDERGHLHVTGRKADTIISGGENVAPAEVEGVLEEHPGVLEAAVVGRPDERWGEAVSAVVVARPGVSVDAEALRAHCAERLAPYKVPKRVELVGGPLPRTSSGKLLRREIG